MDLQSAPPNATANSHLDLSGSSHTPVLYNTQPDNEHPSLPSNTSESHPIYGAPPVLPGALHKNVSSTSLPALRPVFGVSLDDLLKRDGSAVPLVVYQCMQAIDLFGLEVEGIYRLSGAAASVHKLKTIFNNGWSATTSRDVTPLC